MQKLRNGRLLKSLNEGIVLVGKILSPHGIGGVLKVRSFIESLATYYLFSELLVKIPGKKDLIPMELFWVKPYKRGLRISIRGIENRSAAESMVGSNLYAKRSVFPSLEKDTYFCSDLINVAVQSVCGKTVGFLKSVIFTGGNDVYVVERSGVDVSGNSEITEILIPAIKSVVIDVDLINNVMLVDLPDGLGWSG